MNDRTRQCISVRRAPVCATRLETWIGRRIESRDQTYAEAAGSLLVWLAVLAAGCVIAIAARRSMIEEDAVAPTPSPRQGAPVSVVDHLGLIYQRAADGVAADLARALRDLAADPNSRSAAFRAARAADLSRRIEARLAALGAASRRTLDPAFERAVAMGLRQGVDQANTLRGQSGPGIDGPLAQGVTDAMLNDGAAALFARDTAARLDAAAMRIGSDARTVFRSISAGPLAGAENEARVNQALAAGLISGDPRAADRAVRDLFRDPTAPEAESYRRLGARQIEVGGWTGSVGAYAEMLVRTRTREATVSARHDMLAELDIDLVQITGRRSANFCTRYLGLVVSVSGRTPGYVALASLPGGGPPFHPNCSKGTAAYDDALVSSERAAAADIARQRYERDLANGLLTSPIRAA